MKRSQINEFMSAADEFIREHGFTLPPFAYWSVDEFKSYRDEAKAIVDRRCGWDITDFGVGKFDSMGLILFTSRNGRMADLKSGGGMCYAEKLLISRQDQLCPMHSHIVKAEDIINRGGATLVVELFASDQQGNFTEEKGGFVYCDGICKKYSPGEKLRLAPGQSITLMPGDWHAFWAEGGDVLIGEVSTVNNDETDNLFRKPIGRFADIEEDVEPTHLLVNDYDNWLP